MAALSTVFWVLGFILSVLIAPQLRVWTWGPTMLCFGVATALALPVFLRKSAVWESLYVLIPGVAISAWIILRGFFSPVEELATQDLLLVAMSVCTYIVFRAGGGRGVSGNFLVGGIVLILGASLWVIWRQMMDLSFSPIFPTWDLNFIRGFFGHYSYCASFLIPCSLILGGLALVGGHHLVIRIGLLALAIGGVVAVILTKSRGGVVGMGVGLAALAFGVILIGKRDDKKWFAPVAIIAPLLLIGCGIFFLNVLEGVEQSRSQGSDLTAMLDNSIRLYLLGMAASCIGQHLWLGGGSRSFSWECFQAWDVSAYGSGSHKPEHVHNELVQTVSEYGMLGGFLLVAFLGCVVVAFLVKTLAREKTGADKLGDGWRVGGFAGLIGLFLQGQFEGIFRIPPGAILLALCLAAASAAWQKSVQRPRFFPANNLLLFVCALATMIPLFAYGVKGTKASQAMWAAFFGKEPLVSQEKIEALTLGIAAWPTSPLYHERGSLYWQLADEKQSNDEARHQWLTLALADFKSASELHHLDPANLLNRAATLHLLGMSEEAEPIYKEATWIQGEMEIAFQANHRFASFLFDKSALEYARKDFHAAIATLQIALKHIDRSREFGFWSGPLHELHVSVHSLLGQAYEAAGEPKKALEQFDQAVGLSGVGGAHYLAGLMLGTQALKALLARGSEEDALRLFLEAEQRMHQANPLPQGVTEENRKNYIQFLQGSISMLKGKNVSPSESLNF